MTGRQGITEVEGRIVETRPNAMFMVELENGHRVLAHIATDIRVTLGRLVPGDRVTLELSPFDPGRGRIIRRRA